MKKEASERSQQQSQAEDKRIKQRKVTRCPHTESKHYAKGMCNHCYHIHGRKKQAKNCEHSHKLAYARGMCQQCYYKFYNLKKMMEQNNLMESQNEEPLETHQGTPRPLNASPQPKKKREAKQLRKEHKILECHSVKIEAEQYHSKNDTQYNG